MKDSSDVFVENVRTEMENYEAGLVFNTDQMGVALELHSTRTLSHKGEKSTFESIQSQNAISHSYSVQPTISVAGYLTTPVYLCLKEPSGKLSECEITQFANFIFTANLLPLNL